MTSVEPWRWRPLEGLPDGAETWVLPGLAEQEAAWAGHLEALGRDTSAQRFMDAWLRERVRAFAIETGQIEGLYTLRRGMTEQLVAEGFAGVVGAHTVEGLEDREIGGLLEDQEAAYDMVFDDVASGRPLAEHMVRSWQQLLVRHQETVVGLDSAGRRVAVPFRNKGRWKTAPNNPILGDGRAHEYCPPEHVQSEMDRFFALYREQLAGKAHCPANVEAAWLHHRFAGTHPFQDGNGRVSRLLVAWAYLKRSLPPPVVTAEGKADYLNALNLADAGDLRAFSDFLGGLGLVSLIAANQLARQALAGRLERANGNGGRTVGDEYTPLEHVRSG